MKHRFLKSGIMLRWFTTTVLIIFFVLAFITAALLYVFHTYYYDSAEDKLNRTCQSSAVADYFGAYLGADTETFVRRALEYTENFEDKNSAEVWVIDGLGNTVCTSTGFYNPSDPCPDYVQALENPSGRAFWTGRLSSNEKVMALTVLLPKTEGRSNGAVRCLISLDPIDAQLRYYTFILIGFDAFSLILVVISGLFFVNSIVVPVKRLNIAARTIAEGNFTEKVDIGKQYDELTELTESINYMTEEIDRTSRMRNDFISTVSHELRTPLTAIKGWTETLISMDKRDDPTLTEGLDVILSQAAHLDNLVEDLLDFSKLESGRLSLHLQKIDLLAELDESVYALSNRAVREGIRLEYASPDFFAPANADPDRVKQVFINVIDNAIKYTHSGGLITIAAVKEHKNLRVSIKDNGCGISAEDLPHIKEKFYKANISKKGSGIGLAVCSELISMHNGELNVSSVLGEGTTVEIVLPLL